MTPILEARGVALAGRLAPTDLRIEQPSLVAVIGPNGSGKTSLLRAVGQVEQTDGLAIVDGEPLSSAPPARRMRLLGFLPASREVVWPIRARDVVSLGLPVGDEGRVEELIRMLDLSGLADRPIDRLSTGERTRVLLARTMAAKPRLLLLDEPLSNLDPYWALRTLDLLRETVRKERCAAMLALHDLNQLERFDRVLLVEEGQVRADGEPLRVLGSSAFADAFRISMEAGRWRISESVSPGAGPQSSP